MKLSEAIRAGAALAPQVKGVFSLDGGTCALGAAYQAIHGEPPLLKMTVPDLTRYLGVDMFQRVDCPVSHYSKHLFDAVIDLNDDFNWSRERIADWLETLGL